MITTNCDSTLNGETHPRRMGVTKVSSNISKFMKRMNFVIACLRPSQNIKLGIFTGSRAVDGKEMYKKV